MQNTAERRREILDFLSINRKTTYQEIADNFGISTRTAMRDVQILSCSAPIFTIPGNGGGIQVADGWYSSNGKFLNKQQIRLLKDLYTYLDDEDKKIMESILSSFTKPMVYYSDV